MAATGLNAALAAWLQGLLTALSLAVYMGVVPLAGGADGPLWRWVLVEEGLFAVFLLVSTWLTRVVLGVGRTTNWGAAAVVACGLGLVWNWYSLTSSYAVSTGLHPYQGWEWSFFTWGAPLLVAGPFSQSAGFVVHLGCAMAVATGVLLVLARAWSAAGNPFARRGMAKATTAAGATRP